MSSPEATEAPAPTSAKPSEGMPKLNRDKLRQHKLYRCPPTPPLEKRLEKEREFKLDGIAVGNISQDYSRANPKLGSVIPPYNSMEDKAISRYFDNFGIYDLLKKTGQIEKPESIAGKTHDKFFTEGAGFKYLDKRNVNGNGHHPETIDGHSRYMGDNMRVMISYNNMYGYRRNVPKLRTEPPSTFAVDPRWYSRVVKHYGNHYTEEELLEHFKNTYVIGYPFYDNNYNNFHPSVKYVITVKIGPNSPEEYEGNLGINIVARNFDTGFIKLDKNIAVKPQNASKDGGDKQLFNRGQIEVFQFEDQDIRTISAIILSRDLKGEEVLFIEYIDIDVHKSSNEKQSFRFPFNGWLKSAKQDKKAEELKAKFGKKNSIVTYPNEKPKFEYIVKISPPMFKDTEYKVNVSYEIKDGEADADYSLRFGAALPETGRIVVRITGALGQTGVFHFSNKTKSAEDEPLLFRFTNKDVGDIKHVSVLYDNKESKNSEYNLQTFQIENPDGNTYEFEADQILKPNKEKISKGKIISTKTESEEKPESKVDEGQLYIELQSQLDNTNLFELKNGEKGEDGMLTFAKNETNIGTIQNLKLVFQGHQDDFCRIKNIHVTSNKGHDFKYDKIIYLRNKEERQISNENEKKTKSTGEVKSNRQVSVQIFGEKKKTGLIKLKDPQSDEEDLDTFSFTNDDLGKLKNVFVKYENANVKNALSMKYIEIVDPRGNTYKYVMDVILKPGHDIMLPRGAPKDDETETTETETTETEDEKEKNKQSKPTPAKVDSKPTSKKASIAAPAKTKVDEEEEEEE